MNRSLRTLMTGAILLTAASAWAHVVVTPRQAGVASRLIFSVSVPNEKNVATAEIRLALPDGIEEVTPTAKPGWSIAVEKDSAGHADAIVWKGQLPAGLRDDFTFSTQVPDHAVDLAWKAYQTYQDGTVVKWEADPASPDAHDPEAMEKLNLGPYSVTKVVNDLAMPTSGGGPELPLSVVAIVLAIVSGVLSVVALRRR